MRILNSIRDAADTFKRTFTNNMKQKDRINLYKLTKGIKNEALIDIELDHYVSLSLPIMQGIGNKLVSLIQTDATSEELAQLEHLFTGLKMSREVFRKKNYARNLIRKIVQNSPFDREKI